MSYTALLVKASNKACDMLFIQDVTQKKHHRLIIKNKEREREREKCCVLNWFSSYINDEKEWQNRIPQVAIWSTSTNHSFSITVGRRYVTKIVYVND
jgi:hypothetical protein